MKNEISTLLKVKDQDVRVMRIGDDDYISLTDIAKYKNPNDPSDVIKKWFSNYDTIEFLGLWEEISNDNFNSAEFRRIKNEAPKKSFIISANQWCKRVNPVGIITSRGKYSFGTFAHSDIAFEFASWIDNLFKIYLIKEFTRLKKNEAYQNKVDWHASRLLSKANYLIHTNAVKNYIVPELTDKQIRFVYAEEADVLNVALFGMTAKEWRDSNPDLAKNGNIRDHTDLLHLIILSNLENINAELIKMDINQSERLIKLNKTARYQMNLLKNNRSYEKLESLNKDVTLKIENK